MVARELDKAWMSCQWKYLRCEDYTDTLPKRGESVLEEARRLRQLLEKFNHIVEKKKR